MHSPLWLWHWPYSTAAFPSGRSISSFTAHEPYILLDPSVRAEPQFTVKELLCDPAPCTATSAASGPVSALWTGRCHTPHVTCRHPGATTRPAGTGRAPLMVLHHGANALPLKEKGFPSAVFEQRNETWTLPVLCPGSGPCQWSEVQCDSHPVTLLCCFAPPVCASSHC